MTPAFITRLIELLDASIDRDNRGRRTPAQEGATLALIELRNILQELEKENG